MRPATATATAAQDSCARGGRSGAAGRGAVFATSRSSTSRRTATTIGGTRSFTSWLRSGRSSRSSGRRYLPALALKLREVQLEIPLGGYGAVRVLRLEPRVDRDGDIAFDESRHVSSWSPRWSRPPSSGELSAAFPLPARAVRLIFR